VTIPLLRSHDNIVSTCFKGYFVLPFYPQIFTSNTEIKLTEIQRKLSTYVVLFIATMSTVNPIYTTVGRTCQLASLIYSN